MTGAAVIESFAVTVFFVLGGRKQPAFCGLLLHRTFTPASPTTFKKTSAAPNVVEPYKSSCSGTMSGVLNGNLAAVSAYVPAVSGGSTKNTCSG